MQQRKLAAGCIAVREAELHSLLAGGSWAPAFGKQGGGGEGQEGCTACATAGHSSQALPVGTLCAPALCPVGLRVGQAENAYLPLWTGSSHL